MAATENLIKYWTLLSRKFCAAAQFAHLGSQPYSWMEGQETSKKTVSYRSVKKQRCHWQNHVPSNSYIEALIPSVTIFGDRILKVIIKAKWSYNHGAQICRTDVLTRKRRDPRPQINLSLSTFAEERLCEDMRGQEQNLTRNQLCGALVFNF